jgi:hypothetical protein
MDERWIIYYTWLLVAFSRAYMFLFGCHRFVFPYCTDPLVREKQIRLLGFSGWRSKSGFHVSDVKTSMIFIALFRIRL